MALPMPEEYDTCHVSSRRATELTVSEDDEIRLTEPH